jgi:hypothetical protein
MKKTAVEWLIIGLENLNLIKEGDIENELFRQIELEAKEMEKQQIMDPYIECKRQYIVQESCFPPQFVVKEAEQYYNKTYGEE